MKILLAIPELLRRRAAGAARASREAADAEARALLGRMSQREALHQLRLRQQQSATDRSALRQIEAVRSAVFRLSRGQSRTDTATRMHYQDHA